MTTLQPIDVGSPEQATEDDLPSGSPVRLGRLLVYLGMAPGAGKTYRLLGEARALAGAGARVVIGILEPDVPPATAELAADFEVVPPLRLEHRGLVVEELDVDAVIAGAPDVAIVDDLAHRNPPGSARERRWQDIETIREAGITVLATCDVGRLDTLADAVETITGSPIVARIPEVALERADDIEFVDVSPRELRDRLARGEVYTPDRAAALLEGSYSEANLAALREIAVRFVAESLGRRIARGISRDGPAITSVEHVLVVLDDRLITRRAVRRGALLAGSGQATLAAAVIETPDAAEPGSERSTRLHDNTRYAADLGAEIVRHSAPDLVSGLEHVIRSRRVTQLVMAHRRRTGIGHWLGASTADAIAEHFPGLELHILTAEADDDAR